MQNECTPSSEASKCEQVRRLCFGVNGTEPDEGSSSNHVTLPGSGDVIEIAPILMGARRMRSAADGRRRLHRTAGSPQRLQDTIRVTPMLTAMEFRALCIILASPSREGLSILALGSMLYPTRFSRLFPASRLAADDLGSPRELPRPRLHANRLAFLKCIRNHVATLKKKTRSIGIDIRLERASSEQLLAWSGVKERGEKDRDRAAQELLQDLRTLAVFGSKFVLLDMEESEKR